MTETMGHGHTEQSERDEYRSLLHDATVMSGRRLLKEQEDGKKMIFSDFWVRGGTFWNSGGALPLWNFRPD